MRIATRREFLGKTVRDNDQYLLRDSEYLKHLTVSRTDLKPDKVTNGHEHAGKEEVYFFTEGFGTILIKEQSAEPLMISVRAGDVVSIPDGAFHKVAAGDSGLSFIAVFEKYDRTAQVKFSGGKPCI